MKTGENETLFSCRQYDCWMGHLRATNWGSGGAILPHDPLCWGLATKTAVRASVAAWCARASNGKQPASLIGTRLTDKSSVFIWWKIRQQEEKK